MADISSLYHKWLGIAPKDQPPNHYRLLGVDLFESDPDVIDNAADQRLSHVRRFQSGANSTLSQQILNEIASARICLLDPDKKAAYDADLRAKLSSPSAARPVAAAPTPAAQRPMPTSVPTTAAPAPTTAAQSAPVFSPSTGTSPAARRRAQRKNAAGVGGIVLGGLAGLALGYVVLGMINPANDVWNLLPFEETDESDQIANAKNQPGSNGQAHSAPGSTGTSPAGSSDHSANSANSANSGGSSPIPTDTAGVSTSPTTDASSKRAPPSAEQRQLALSKLDAKYEFSVAREPDQWRELAQLLLADGLEVSDAIQQYVLLVQAAKAARHGGDARLVRDVLAEVGARYDAETTQMAVDELTQLAQDAADPATIDSLVANFQSVIDQAIQDGQVGKAVSLFDAVEAAVQRSAGQHHADRLEDVRRELDLTSQLWQQVKQARARLNTNPNDAAARQFLRRWPPQHHQPIAAGEVPMNRWFYVSGLVDPEQDTVSGTWRRSREAVQVVKGLSVTLITPPVRLDGSYEADVDFTSKVASDFFLVMPVLDRQFVFWFAANNNQYSGISGINGTNIHSSPAKQEANGIQADKRHRFRIGVNVQGDQVEILSNLDGNPYVGWKGPIAKLNPWSGFDLPTQHAMAFGTRRLSQTTYHVARLRVIDGRGELLRDSLIPARSEKPPPEPPQLAGNQPGMQQAPDQPSDSSDSGSDAPPRTLGQLLDPDPDSEPEVTGAKSPPPTAAQQQAALEIIQELYELDEPRDAMQNRKLAGELLELGRQSKDTAEQYTLLMQVAEAARQAGDARLVRSALDAVQKRFETDVTTIKLQEFTKLAQSVRETFAMDSLIANLQPVVEQAVAEQKVDLAVELVDEVHAATRKPFGRRYAKEIGLVRKELTKIHRLWEQFQSASQTLAEEPDHADANLVAGRWYLFQQGEWNRGLLHLSKGSDEQLKQLARQDRAAAEAAPDAKIAIADAWYKAAEGQEDEPSRKYAMLGRARYWYQQAQPDVASQLFKSKVAKRLEELANVPARTGQLGAHGELPLGHWVYVLGKVDPRLDAVEGEWAKQWEAMGVVTPARRARFALPVTLKGSYDLEVDFTSFDGQELSFILPVGGNSCQLALCSWQRTTGINLIDGRTGDSNASTVKPSPLIQNRRHAVLVRVQVEGEMARIVVHFDGRPHMQWEGRWSSLAPPPDAAIPNDDQPGLESEFDTRAVFHTARVRLLSGEGRAER